MLDKLSELARLRAGLLRLSFINEPPEIVASVIKSYADGLAALGTGAKPRREFDNAVVRHYSDGFTHGYFYMGVI